MEKLEFDERSKEDNFLWIARDKDHELYVFDSEPYDDGNNGIFKSDGHSLYISDDNCSRFPHITYDNSPHRFGVLTFVAEESDTTDELNDRVERLEDKVKNIREKYVLDSDFNKLASVVHNYQSGRITKMAREIEELKELKESVSELNDNMQRQRQLYADDLNNLFAALTARVQKLETKADPNFNRERALELLEKMKSAAGSRWTLFHEYIEQLRELLVGE